MLPKSPATITLCSCALMCLRNAVLAVRREMEQVVELSRAGCETLEFQMSEINPSTVANAFQVSIVTSLVVAPLQLSRMHHFLQLDPKTVFLKQEFGRRCYFPEPRSGQFNLGNEVGECVLALTVEGAPFHTATQTVPCSVPSTSSPNSFPHYKPIASKKDGSFNVKVVKAIMKKLPNGKVEFERLEQTFVSLDDSCANVGTVNNAVQLKWGPEYVLVTADGLEIDDSAGTQGKPFV